MSELKPERSPQALPSVAEGGDDGAVPASPAVENLEDGGNVFHIVLTGGPCAGKTTALERLSAFLRERGFRVFTVPEAATMLFSNGVFFSDLSSEDNVATFQAKLMGVQIRSTSRTRLRSSPRPPLRLRPASASLFATAARVTARPICPMKAGRRLVAVA